MAHSTSRARPPRGQLGQDGPRDGGDALLLEPRHREHQHELAGDEHQHRRDVHAADGRDRLLEGLEEGPGEGLEERGHGVERVHPREQRLEEDRAHHDVDGEPGELHQREEQEDREHGPVRERHALQEREDGEQEELRPPGHRERGEVQLEEARDDPAQGLSPRNP